MDLTPNPHAMKSGDTIWTPQPAPTVPTFAQASLSRSCKELARQIIRHLDSGGDPELAARLAGLLAKSLRKLT